MEVFKSAVRLVTYTLMMYLFYIMNNASRFIGHHMLLRDFGPYVIIFVKVFCYNRYHENVVKEGPLIF
jgi:hypothetical protein